MIKMEFESALFGEMTSLLKNKNNQFLQSGLINSPSIDILAVAMISSTRTRFGSVHCIDFSVNL